jgi:CBS domain-containing protein
MQSVQQMLGNRSEVIYQVQPNDSVFDAIKKMAEHGVGALVVLEGQTLVGIVSERDYARKVVLQGKNSKDTQVREIMSAPVITASLDQRASQCMRLMTEKRIRHMPVVNAGRVVGMLSIGDLLKAAIEHLQQENAQLSQYINS